MSKLALLPGGFTVRGSRFAVQGLEVGRLGGWEVGRPARAVGRRGLEGIWKFRGDWWRLSGRFAPLPASPRFGWASRWEELAVCRGFDGRPGTGDGSAARAHGEAGLLCWIWRFGGD